MAHVRNEALVYLDDIPIEELVYQHVIEAFARHLPPPHSRQIARGYDLKATEVADACHSLIAEGRLIGNVLRTEEGEMYVRLTPVVR